MNEWKGDKTSTKFIFFLLAWKIEFGIEWDRDREQVYNNEM